MDEPLQPHLPALVEHERTLLRLPSRPDWIEPAADYLCRKAVLCGACPEAQSSRLLIALHEALSNAVVHGNLEISSELKERGDSAFAEALAARAADPRFADRTVEVAAAYDGTRCRWTLTDQGKGFDVDRVLSCAASDDPERLPASGRGILMMRAFLDDVRWEAGGRRVILTLYKTAERRHSDRRAVREPVRVAPVREDGSVDWDAAYQAVARNLSEGGMAILQGRLATTDRILLGIPRGETDGGEPLYVPAEVRHLRRLGDNEVELGCRFLVEAPLPTTDTPPTATAADVGDAVGQFLDRQQSQLPLVQERRHHPRVAYTEQIGLSAAPGVGFARDLSKGGIAFITTAPVEVGVQVLTLPQGPDRAPMRVQARVVRCRKITENFYDVAACFVGLEP
jgi:anti-sigma regulatory factor (Ser/Thr protein kinase)